MIRLRWAVAVWAGILVVISLRVLLASRANSVYPIFSAAGRHWLAGELIYPPPTGDLDVFRYSPPVAAFFAPWSLLPDRPAGVLWRVLNAAVFFGGLAAWSRWQRPSLSSAAMAVLVIPLAVSGLNNGQCNALMIGSFLLAHVTLGRQRWWSAAALIAIPVLLKGYPLALGLLFCLVEPRRLTPRLAVCLLVGAALPYLCQRADYVNEQYAVYVERLVTDDRTGLSLDAGYRDLHMLLRRVGVPMDLRAYRLVEVQLGLLAAGAVVLGRIRGWDKRAALMGAFSLGSCWMTLAGPATESSTYVLLAPVLAHAAMTTRTGPASHRWLVWTSFGMFAVAAAATWFPARFSRPFLATGIQPFAALLLMVHVVAEVVRSFRNESGRPPAGPAAIQPKVPVTSSRQP